ncbi:MAG: alpha/beta hydrolase [Deltaproteobacteria bacterium]|nr:alpha/beta hydrolase [Deltaproteobacteria bacterium]
MSNLPASVRAWLERGRFVRLAGLEVFVLDTGAKADAVPLVVLHGFPTSSHDFHRVLPQLSENRRVVLLDFPGFGLSEKPTTYSYSLHEQADLVVLLLRQLGIRSAHWLAHDMGTSVACELLARRERGLLEVETRSVVLMNGSVHIELAQLTPSQRILRTPLGKLFVRLSSKRVFRAQMQRIVTVPLSDADLDAMWAQLAYADGVSRLPSSIGYVEERYRFWHRWIPPLTRLDVPTMVLWGIDDPVAVVAIAEKLASEIPHARLVRLEGIGHYPTLEAPDRVASLVDGFVSGAERGKG